MKKTFIFFLLLVIFRSTSAMENYNIINIEIQNQAENAKYNEDFIAIPLVNLLEKINTFSKFYYELNRNEVLLTAEYSELVTKQTNTIKIINDLITSHKEELPNTISSIKIYEGFTDHKNDFSMEDISMYILYSALTAIIFIAIISFLIYLPLQYLNSKTNKRSTKNISDAINKLQNEVTQIKETEFILSENDKEKIKEDFIKNSSTEIVNNISSQHEKIKSIKRRSEISESHFLETRDRLLTELSSTSKRVNLNLSIGIAISIIGVIFLGYYLLISNTKNFNTAEEFAIYFTPRLTIVVLVEIFAYFFLRLYKENISDIKYIQNEITTIEFKYLALKVSVDSDDIELIKQTITNLLQIERNFILSNGQSTIDLERNRIELESQKNIMEKIFSSAIKKT